ncbi:MAG: YicC family protein [Polyangiaceae bacterium]|nr:YicC family protein [Polyangiaceae bacterium]MCB9608462.1 YicC family protein [Polyangiaceae bacterium]
MRSMTGFGFGEADLDGGRVVVEIRSLNHRFLDVRVRLPADLQEQASFLEQLARAELGRGRYDIGVRVEGGAQTRMFSEERARNVYHSLARLRDELAPGTELPVSVLGQLSHLITASPADTETPVQAALASAMKCALAALQEMRETEGQTLCSELEARLGKAREASQRIAERAPEAIAHQHQRLKERVARLLSDTGVQLDPTRLAQEVALLADKSDITEELVRLDSHFDQFASLLEDPQAVGRRLDFLLQEMARESNTIGAKSQDAGLSHLVVELKAEVERLREQVQNVE